MFDNFGEFDSYEEMNRAAAAQLAEGDEEAILIIAEENGIDKEDALEFIEGLCSEFCTPLMAAIGKLAIEEKELNLEGLFGDWKEQISQMCTDDEKLCLAVRKKGKRLEECIGKILKISFETKKQVDERICKAAGLRNTGRKDPVYLGIPNRAEVKKIIRGYYLGEEKA